MDLNHWYGPFPPESHEHRYSSYISQQTLCTRCGAEGPEAETVMSGDLKGDGTVTSADAVLLARFLVGVIDDLKNAAYSNRIY